MPSPPGNMALMFGFIKGNQWVFIVPKNKAGYFLGGKRGIGGVGPLDSHEISGSLLYTWMTLVVFPALKWRTLRCDYLQAVVDGEVFRPKFPEGGNSTDIN